MIVTPDEEKKTGTVDQQRAAYAWQCVQQCSRDYTNLAKSAPALIMGNGLMQTLAFYQAKGKDRNDNHYKKFTEHILKWLGQRFGGEGLSNGTTFPHEHQTTFEEVMRALHQAGSRLYRQATDETLALLRWIRLFAPTQEHNGNKGKTENQ